MALTDQEIEDFADANGHACAIVHGEMGREVIWYDGDLTPFARAIEAAATAPLLERIAALTAQVEQAAQPVMVQFRWTNPGDNPNPTEDEMKWHEVVPNFKWQTVQDRIAALLAYQYNGKPCYEIRSLYTAPPKAAALTVPEVEQILARWSYELHGDRARYIVRETELAHGITPATVEKEGE